jgi:teichuronic acid biosynthesis glycosyltransferase TuaH
VSDEPARRDAVFIRAYVSWDAMARRGGNFAQDRLTRRLLDAPELDHFVVGEPFRSVLSPVADIVRRRKRTPFPQLDGRHRFKPLRFHRKDPVDVKEVERAYRAYDKRLERAVRRLGLDAPAVITTHPLVAGLAPLEWAGSVTFYCTDDWTAYPAMTRWRPAYEASFERFSGSGRRLCAVSAPLVERLAPTGPAIVVPNGLEPAEWERVPAPPDAMAELPRPRLAYVGTLDSRIDVEALAALAGAMPEAMIVLAGPITEPEALGRLPELPNVRILPPVRREGVSAILGAADVGLVPHVETDLTRAMSPLKLYEYLAAGLPVVATNLPPMRGVHPRVELVAPGGSMVEPTHRALAAGRLAEAERRRFITENSWAARHERILALALS